MAIDLSLFKRGEFHSCLKNNIDGSPPNAFGHKRYIKSIYVFIGLIDVI